MSTKEKPYAVIGVIDSNDAIHFHPICTGDYTTHDALWPMITHKRWRFNISEWQLENSILSKGNLTAVEAEMIYDHLRKHFTPPFWFLKGEEWEALGRPRSGKKYEEHEAKWEKIRKKKFDA